MIQPFRQKCLSDNFCQALARQEIKQTRKQAFERILEIMTAKTFNKFVQFRII